MGAPLARVASPDRGITAFGRPSKRLVLKRLGRKLSCLEGHPSPDFFVNVDLRSVCAPNAVIPQTQFFLCLEVTHTRKDDKMNERFTHHARWKNFHL
eukprot:scaffold13804_cov92-Skeletonema_dohrnii-CCMP3373.AAC.3